MPDLETTLARFGRGDHQALRERVRRWNKKYDLDS